MYAKFISASPDMAARQIYPVMDLIAIPAPDFGFNWGKNGEFWIKLPWMWILL